MRARLLDYLRGFDQPRFAICGGAIALLSLLIVGQQKHFDAWAPRHLDGVAWILVGLYDGAAIVALWVVWPAIITAVLGRSPVAPQDLPKK